MRFATVPILWNNDDVPGPTPAIAWETVLDEIAAAGFAGTELGTNFPHDAAVLGPALASRGLSLAAAYYAPGLIEGVGIAAALNQVNELLDLLVALDCRTLIVAEPLVPERARMAGRVTAQGGRSLSDDQWENLAEGLNELGARCQKRGLELALHPNAGTFIETPMEIKKVLNLTDSTLVGLCLDTGHIAYGGGNPVDLLNTYARRVRHVHLKDLDRAVYDAITRAGLGLHEALRRRVFCEVGQGAVDMAAIVSLLQDAGYEGWIVAEQDTCVSTPLAAARANRAALDRLFLSGKV